MDPVALAPHLRAFVESGLPRFPGDPPRRSPPSVGLECRAPTATPSPRREATPCPVPPVVGAGNLREPVGCAGLSEPNAGLGGYEASWRDNPPWVLCRPAKARAGLGERRVRLMVWECGPYGDLWGMATAYGLAGCEIADLWIFVNLWKVAGVYGGLPGCMWIWKMQIS